MAGFIDFGGEIHLTDLEQSRNINLLQQQKECLLLAAKRTIRKQEKLGRLLLKAPEIDIDRDFDLCLTNIRISFRMRRC